MTGIFSTRRRGDGKSRSLILTNPRLTSGIFILAANMEDPKSPEIPRPEHIPDHEYLSNHTAPPDGQPLDSWSSDDGEVSFVVDGQRVSSREEYEEKAQDAEMREAAQETAREATAKEKLLADVQWRQDIRDAIAAIPAQPEKAPVHYYQKLQPRSASKRAGLNFPVSRVRGALRSGRFAARCSPGSAVYLAAVLEYITAEVVELAGNCAKDAKVKRIKPRHLNLVIRGDEELDKLLTHVVVPDGGVLPRIHVNLLKETPAKPAAPSQEN